MEQDTLFPLPEPSQRRSLRSCARLKNPVWTKNKASLIQRYLRYFVFITRHGTYIDGFAGPQRRERAESWAARLVLRNDPKWLRNFVLCDRDPDQVHRLKELKKEHSKDPKRSITILSGDFNVLIANQLARNPIKDTEATFCLLDQRTFECKWATVEAIARHKKGGMKIEVFYFLPAKWLSRAVKALKSPDADMKNWWGNEDWRELLDHKGIARAQYVAQRFEKELGYGHAVPYPILAAPGSSSAMFYMIHASDHEQACQLMTRAYNGVLGPLEPPEQLEWEIGRDSQKIISTPDGN